MVAPQAVEPVVLTDAQGVRREEISRCPYLCVEKVELDSWGSL